MAAPTPTVEYVPDEEAKEDTSKAPVRLMTDFLKAVQDEETVEALRLADIILTIEPGNTMILEYRTALKQIDADEAAEAKEEGEEKGSSSDEESDDAKDDDEAKDDDSTESKEGEDVDEEEEDEDLPSPSGESGEAKTCALSVDEHLARFTKMFEAAESERSSELAEAAAATRSNERTAAFGAAPNTLVPGTPPSISASGCAVGAKGSPEEEEEGRQGGPAGPRTSGDGSSGGGGGGEAAARAEPKVATEQRNLDRGEKK